MYDYNPFREIKEISSKDKSRLPMNNIQSLDKSIEESAVATGLLAGMTLGSIYALKRKRDKAAKDKADKVEQDKKAALNSAEMDEKELDEKVSKSNKVMAIRKKNTSLNC